MGDVGPKGAVTDGVVDSVVEFGVGDLFHVPGYRI